MTYDKDSVFYFVAACVWLIGGIIHLAMLSNFGLGAVYLSIALLLFVISMVNE